MSEPDLTFHATLVEIDQRAVICVLAKQHFVYDHARRELVADPEFYQPMVDDYIYETHPDRNGRLLRHGRDLWPVKEATDVIVQGHAYAPAGQLVTSMPVSVTVGQYRKEIIVYGDRIAELHGSTVKFSEPEAFEKISLDWWNAYGGIDPNFLPKSLDDTPLLLGMPLVELFPGAYPRNPMGVGYVVDRSGFINGMLLPNLEDPSNPLTPEQLIVGDPRNWWQCPRPAGFGWVASMSFPRCIHAGHRPYFLPERAQQSEIPEVREGWVSLEQLNLGVAELSLRPRLTTEASSGLTFASLASNTMFRLEGFSPEGPIAFRLPLVAPNITAQHTGTQSFYDASAHVHTVCIDADTGKVSVVWCVRFVLTQADTLRIAAGAQVEDIAQRYAVSVEGRLLTRAHWPMTRESADDDYEK